MTSTRDAIRENNRLARMRMGQEAADYVTIPSMPEIRAMLIPLTEKESQRGVWECAMLDVPDNAAGLTARNRTAMQWDVFHALREPDDLTKQVFTSIDEMIGENGLTPEDIDIIHEQLSVMMEYSSPAIDGMTDKEFDAIKKAFTRIVLSELSGRQWAAVKLCCQYLFGNLLPDRSLGTFSTEPSTEKNENPVST